MALQRDEADQPELRVVRGRGRPRKRYPRHDGALAPGSLDWQRLAKLHEITVLRDGYRLGTLPAVWYKPATDERLGDGLTVAWLAEYRALFPAAWRRMRATTRGYRFWTEKTATKRTAQENAATKAFLRFMVSYSTSSRGATLIPECVTLRRVTCAACHHEFLTGNNSRFCSLFCCRDYKTN